MRLRLIEPPLGDDAKERPSLEQVRSAWAAALRQPVPDYDGETLRRFLIARERRT